VSTGFFLVGIDTTLPAVEWVEPREALEVVDIPVVVQHKRSKAGSSAMREQVFFFLS